MKVGHLELGEEELMGTSRSGLYLKTKGSRRKVSTMDKHGFQNPRHLKI